MLEYSKTIPDGTDLLNEAYRKVIKAIKSLPGDGSEENIEKYLKLRDSINFYIDYEQKFQKNLETLKQYDKGELFTITGMNFHKNDIKLTPDMSLKLVKESNNEFDGDAIAVYVGDEKIGYVANKDYTKYELTSSASELQDKISDTAQGRYLFYLNRYEKVQFPVGRIIR